MRGHSFLVKIYLALVPNFFKNICSYPSRLFIISSRQVANQPQKQSELSRAKAKNYKQNFKQIYTFNKSHSILNVDNYLNLISKYQSLSFSSCKLEPVSSFALDFLQSFFSFAVSPLPRKYFLFLFSVRTSLNFKVASQSLNFEMKDYFYW